MRQIDERALRSIIDTIAKEVSSARALNLEAAQQLSAQIRAKAKELGVKAVVAIADRGGHPILVECMDDAFIASYDIAVHKAFTVVALKMSTSDLKPLAQPGGSLYGVQLTNQGKIVIFGGGEPLKDAAGTIIGGLGVSGGTEEQDAALAAYGRKLFEKGRY